MSGRVHMVAGALRSLNALLQHELLGPDEGRELASLIRKGSNDDQAYHELLYRVKLRSRENEGDTTASRLYKEMCQAVEGGCEQ